MIEGKEHASQALIDRLHGILRPFLLRRMKADVAKQLPPKTEVVMICKLSKRQRQLYDEFMAHSDTRNTLSSTNYLGLMNVLMQLRKVCNHPDLFAQRPIYSPFAVEAVHGDFLKIVDRFLVVNEFSHVLFTILVDFSFTPFSALSFKALELSADNFERLVIAFTAKTLKSSLHPLQTNFFSLANQTRANQMMALTRARISVHALLNSAKSWLIRNQSCYSQKLLVVDFPALSIHNSLQGSEILRDLVKLPYQRFSEMQPLLMLFVCLTPRVLALPASSMMDSFNLFHESVLTPLESTMQLLQPIRVRQALNFPDASLLQYDCGKLQQLARLLLKLKVGGHRALIFTQMTKMLDLLEVFINMHGYTYLRLDGSTKIEQRQKLMERFNSDPKIFIFILSTRSGGIGVNLTGADTVIFYDTDWNPAMDAQAQDRCHRIGQTRPVTIYRLISESTVEENILKKANQVLCF